MWSILTNPNFINTKWNKEEFYNTGENDVNNWFSCFEEIKHIENGTALDFGCGIGRLTQALCSRFINVKGVDISETMISLAKENNRFSDRCLYFQNNQNDLKIFENDSFDFIVSHITLQHLPKSYIFNYIEEFIRIIKPGGIILFSLPSKPPFIYWLAVRIFTQRFINIFRRAKYKMKYVMEMHWVNERKMKRFVETHGKLINMNPNFSVGKNWEGYMYVVSK